MLTITNALHLGALVTVVYGARRGCEPKAEQCCAVEFRDLSTEHIELLGPPASAPLQQGVTDADKKLIVDLHNDLRGSVESTEQPAATDMLSMVWDDDLARTAQKWASRCDFRHSEFEQRERPCYYEVGENLAAWVEEGKDWKRCAIDFWFDEHRSFKFGEGPTAPGQIVTHYTQMVWAKTSRIGCGYALCKPLKHFLRGAEPVLEPAHFYVCHYGPTGNIGATEKEQNTPYTEGTKGSDCPKTFNRETGLCDCKGMTCYWHQMLDPDTCKCICNDTNLEKSNGQCLLDCDKVTDDPDCGTGKRFTPADCTATPMSNVKFLCPTMCRLCPCPRE